MKQQPAPPGLRAAFDRQRAAIFAMQSACPENGRYDEPLAERIRERFLTFMERPATPDDSWTPGTCYLLWGDGRAVQVEPHPDVLAMAGLSTAPRLAATACDGCNRVGSVGVALVAAPPHVVGLVLCGPCASYVNPDPFLTPDQGDSQ